MCSPTKRRDMDVMKLMMTDYKVETVENSMSDFFVEFKGPADNPYFGGVWKVRVVIPEAYPYKSPSIGFVNKIYHPNIDERHGAPCSLWLYPNPSDPLNGGAAALMMRDRSIYEQKVKEYCERYAKPSDTKGQDSETTDDDDDEGDTDEDGKYTTSEDEMDVEGGAD